jgi:zinc protease
VRSDYDRTHVTATGVPDALPDILAAIAALAFKADLKDSEIDAELGSLTQEVRNHYDEPATVAFLESVRSAFPGHPYRFPPLGHFRTIGTLKREPLLGFYRNLWVPNHMALAVAGDFDPGRAAALIESAFGAERRSGTLPPAPAAPTVFPGHDDIEKRLDLRETWTTLVFTAPGYRHPDRPAFEALARWLADVGGSPILSALVRARVGSAARVFYYGLEDAGLLYVGLVPSTPQLSYAAADVALAEIARIRATGLTAAQVREVAARLLRDKRREAERLETRAEGLAEALLFGGARYYWDLPLAYARLTPADIARVAAAWLVPENTRLVVILPKDAPPLAEADKAKVHATLERLAPEEGVALPPPAHGRTLFAAAEADRVSPRAWGDPAAAAGLPAPRREVLDNGLTILLQPDGRHGLAAVSLQLPTGSAHDPPGREGLAFIAGRFLAAGSAASGDPPRGSGRKRRHAPETAPRAGAAPGAGAAVPGGASLPDILPEPDVGRDLTEVRILFERDDLRRVLEGLARSLREPVVPEGAFETLRRAAREAHDRPGSDPAGLALDLFREKVYAGHPYARRVAGTPASLDALRLEDVREFLARRAGPRGAVLAIAGAIEPQEAARLARDLLSPWKPREAGRGAAAAAGDGGGEAAEPAAAPAVARALAGAYSRDLSSPQSHVLVGAPGPPLAGDGVRELRLLGTALTVLAFEDLVFRRRAAFSAAAVPEALRDGGALAIAVVAPHHRRDEAVFDVQRLMRRLALEELPAADLEDMARVQAGREAASTEGVLALASYLSYREAAGPGAEGGAGDRSPARLREIAARYLKPESWVVIRVGPASR